MNSIEEIELSKIEMTDTQKTILIGAMLQEILQDIDKSLSLTSNTEQRIQLLKRKISIEYALETLFNALGGNNDNSY